MLKKGFQFGVSTSSYQIEGTKNKFKSIWDLETRNVIDKSDGSIACDFYSKYIEDIKLIKDLGVDVYRMSLSWARIQPYENSFSEDGIDFYHRVFKELKRQDIKVDVTLYHWDMPLWLYESGVGFHDSRIVNYFFDYAKKAFKEFDIYVNKWATFNEPWCVSRVGYYYKTHAPFLNDLQKSIQADYYQLIAHLKTYDFYKANYQKPIGIVFNVWGHYPHKDTKDDKLASYYSHLFFEGCFFDPMFKGRYDNLWINRLTELGLDISYIDDKLLETVKDKADYLGINYYMHNTVIYDKKHEFYFSHINTTTSLTDMDWEVNPEGLKNILKSIRENYTDLPIIITENGAAYKDDLINGIIKDDERCKYIKSHLEIIEEISVDLNIEGYYVWSLMDNFEWNFGYLKRFGIVYVDYETLVRTKKQSYYMYHDLIREKRKI